MVQTGKVWYGSCTSGVHGTFGNAIELACMHFVQAGKFATVQMSLDCQQFNSSPYSQSRLLPSTHYGSFFTYL